MSLHPAPEPAEGSPHIVVVGSGIAGLTTAIRATDRGCRVTLVTKDELEHANTRFAQGGIAGVMFGDDRIDDHIADTLTAGAGLCDPLAVRVLAEEGPARIRDLVAAGVAFDRGADGGFVKGLEAAHSYPRILHAGGDATGTAIESALVMQVRAGGIRVLEHAFLVDLVVHDGRTTGVELLVGGASTGAPRREVVAADAVVLATGGAGRLYAHTTNPPVATGDGIAAALRAGARIDDLEFFQFHPTVVGGADAFLISEAVRGEGATLIDEEDRRFTFDVHPDGELAPRDVVARAIARRMERQDGRPVRLDATHLHSDDADERAAFLARRFPTIDAALRARGFDWARTPVPVTPAAHYLMGGVTTDLDGRTTVPGLYAVGEVARTGAHGANRLASNSLLEGAVFGARVADVVATDAASGSWPRSRRFVPPSPVAPRRRSAGPHPDRPHGAAGEPPAAQPFSREALQRLMWEYAGLVRDADGLEHAAGVLESWRDEPRTPGCIAEFEDENLLVVASALVDAALARRESVGAHFRADGGAPVPAHSRAVLPTARSTTPVHPIRTHQPEEAVLC
ncbi:L-aspartate oxidase [Microbacterium sp. NPDC055910]|uniref:L-aspartate oxidase n=1 Tax=Microbacterium sp. NPDC055910 TaxID=3345659 RepID=UPI0035D9D6EB